MSLLMSSHSFFSIRNRSVISFNNLSLFSFVTSTASVGFLLGGFAGCAIGIGIGIVAFLATYFIRKKFFHRSNHSEKNKISQGVTVLESPERKNRVTVVDSDSEESYPGVTVLESPERKSRVTFVDSDSEESYDNINKGISRSYCHLNPEIDNITPQKNRFHFVDVDSVDSNNEEPSSDTSILYSP